MTLAFAFLGTCYNLYMAQYSTKSVTQRFGISHTALKAWCAEFGRWLSPTATPPAGQKRIFQESDLAVFALISDYKQRGLKYSDIHAALQSGERGNLTAPSPIDQLPAAARDLIVRLRDEMDDLRSQLEAERAATNKAVGRADLLRELLEEKEHQLREAFEEIARLKAQK